MTLLPHLVDTPFTTLILGYGWKICPGLEQLPLQCGLPKAKHVVWYFGDLDWEGIRIFTTLQTESTLDVRLASAKPSSARPSDRWRKLSKPSSMTA